MALIVKHGAATLLNGSSTFFAFTPKSTTSWKCLQVAAWNCVVAWQANNTAGRSSAVFVVQVSLNTIAEFRIGFAFQDMRFPSLVIPWGDGVSYNGNELFRITATYEGNAVVPMAATMIGEE